MRKLTVFVTLLALLGCFLCPAYAATDDDVEIIYSGIDSTDSADYPELNPEPEPPSIDPALVQTIEIHMSDGRVFEFNVPIEQFGTATISHLLGFIKADDPNETITLYSNLGG